MQSLSWVILVKLGDEQMIIELDEELRLSKFRKIMTLIAKSGKVIKVEINGKYYDISRITDKKDMTILEIYDETIKDLNDVKTV